MASCNGSLVSDLRQCGVYGEQLELEQAFLGVLSIYLSSSPSVHPSVSQSVNHVNIPLMVPQCLGPRTDPIHRHIMLPISYKLIVVVTLDLHLAAEGQWSGGRGIHWYQHLYPSAAEHQEPDPGSRCIQVNQSAALPGRVSHSLPCQQGMFPSCNLYMPVIACCRYT